MRAKKESKAWPTAATFCVAAAFLLSGCYSDGMSGDFNVTVIGGPPAEPVQPPPYTGPMYVRETDPAANETWVPPHNVVIRARFSFMIKPITFDPSMFTLTDNAGVAVAGTASCSWTDVEFRPSSPLLDFSRYTATVAPGLGDFFSDASMTDGHTWSFSTGPSGTGTWRAMNPANAPEARQSVSPIWTGSEMVVWGGEVYYPPQDIYWKCSTGGRYNPVTDSWASTSADGVPRERADHTSVWTGAEMIVWGGEDSGHTRLNTGGRYDPAADSWRATPTAGAPSGRSKHTAVWTGTEMIVWGGVDNIGGRYDPVGDTWRPVSGAGAPSGRYGHVAVWTGTEMIIWGGIEIGYYLSPVTTGARYNPVTDSWTPMSVDGAPGGGYHRAVWTGTELIVWGPLSSGRYRPDSGTWMPLSTANAPPGRDGTAAVWTGSQLILWGGFDDSGNPEEIGIRYVPSTDTWGATTAVGAPRELSRPMAVWTGTEMIVWGTTYDYVAGYVTTGGRYSP